MGWMDIKPASSLYDIFTRSAEWTVTVTADNAASTATRNAVAGQSHYITSIHGSFSVANAGKLMTLKDGATIIGNFHVMSVRDIEFTTPIKITAGAAVELLLAASGTAGQVGAVTITGFTRAL